MKISVVGSINMDMTVKAERIPLKGETLKGEDLKYIPGGKGANQAVAMAKLGADVEMFGCVGNDSAGKELVQNLKDMGVKTNNIRAVDGVPTGIALITVGENDNTIMVVAGANDCVDKAYVDSIKEELLQSEVVVLQHEIPQETNEYVIRLCHENNVKVVLNPGPARPVKKEIVDLVLITQGAKGVSMCLAEGKVLLVPARRAEVVDTTGAGDTLNGAFTVQIAKGESVKDALRFGNIAASLSTEKFGAQGGMPTFEEVTAELNRI